jgi:pyrophosphatase PpaX
MGLNPKALDRNPDKMWSIFMNAYEPLENKCRSRTGAKSVLQFLQNNKIMTVIFSNHMTHHIQKQLKRLAIYSYVDKILARGLNDVSHLHIKSKDKKISGLIRKLKIKPKQVLVVGDTDEEVDIAKFFGYYSAALTGGNTSTPRLRATNPDYLIHNLKDLKQIINKLNS